MNLNKRYTYCPNILTFGIFEGPVGATTHGRDSLIFTRLIIRPFGGIYEGCRKGS